MYVHGLSAKVNIIIRVGAGHEIVSLNLFQKCTGKMFFLEFSIPYDDNRT
jgi:hypothetical protein